jgi:hypothetical protein
MMFVHIVDHVVHKVEIMMSIHVCKIATKKYKNIVSKIVLRSIIQMIEHILSFLRSIVYIRVFVILKRIFIIDIEAKSRRETVMVVKNM